MSSAGFRTRWLVEEETRSAGRCAAADRAASHPRIPDSDGADIAAVAATVAGLGGVHVLVGEDARVRRSLLLGRLNWLDR